MFVATHHGFAQRRGHEQSELWCALLLNPMVCKTWGVDSALLQLYSQCHSADQKWSH